jgi:hypothetical protein
MNANSFKAASLDKYNQLQRRRRNFEEQPGVIFLKGIDL